MRQKVNGFAIVLLLVCCAIWGFQPIVLKWTSVDMPPIMQLAFRSAGSLLCLWGYLAWRGMPLMPAKTLWRAGLLVGVLFMLEFVFVGWSIRYTLASHLTVCIYTAPIFVAIGLHFHSEAERLNVWQWLGVLLAFTGIVVAFLLPEWQHPSVATADSPNTWWGISPRLIGDLLGILAGLFWALTTLAVRYSVLSEAEPEYTLAVQLIVSAIGLNLIVFGGNVGDPTAASALQAVNWSGALLLSLLFQAVMVSFASYLAWFWMLRHYVAGRISVFSFMTPLFGISFGVLFLQEPVTAYTLLGTTLVIAGICGVSFGKKTP